MHDSFTKFVFGGGRGSSGGVSKIPNNYFDVFDTRRYLLSANVDQVAFQSFISTVIDCNDYYILLW